eukprot:NODE_935_length_2999_cov_0.620110.p2 type:complete len:150 gc:universal NODE_935_length_2999_cov_0.620110:2758-2309(-)
MHFILIYLTMVMAIPITMEDIMIAGPNIITVVSIAQWIYNYFVPNESELRITNSIGFKSPSMGQIFHRGDSISIIVQTLFVSTQNNNFKLIFTCLNSDYNVTLYSGSLTEASGYISNGKDAYWFDFKKNVPVTDGMKGICHLQASHHKL